LFLFCALVWSDKGNNDEGSRPQEEQDGFKKKFDIKADVSDYGFEMGMFDSGSNTQAFMSFEFEVEGFMEIRLRYSQHSRVDKTKNVSIFRVRLHNVHTYDESGANVGYQPGADTNLTLLSSLQKQNLNPIKCTNTGTQNGGSVSYDCNITTKDGLVRIAFYFQGAARIAGGVMSPPTDLKFSFYVLNKPAKPVVLEGAVRTGTFFKVNQSMVHFDTTAFFTWIPTYTNNGVSHDVVTYVDPQDGTEDHEFTRKTWFSFSDTSAGNIDWDPNFGGEVLSHGQNLTPAFVVFLFALLSLFY